jgi:pimeloyl-ACP methyl ester carboxylesterase
VHYWHASPSNTSRTPLIFLHPGPHSTRVQVRLLNVLAETRPVYAPDIMGMGDSAPPPAFQEQPPELDYFADAVHRFADALSLGRFDVYGSNLSARIGVEMALQRPDRIRRLILNRIAFIEGDELEMWATNHVPVVTPDQSGAYVTFLWSRLRDLNTYVPWFRKGADNLRGKGLPPADILHQAFTEQVKMAPTMHLAFDAYWRYPIKDKLPRVQVPTLARDDVVALLPGARVWTPVIRGNVVEAAEDNLRAFAAQIGAYLDDD